MNKPPKYLMLALDLDGTLTNSKKQITPVTFQALSRAADLGVTIVLASGRPVMGMQQVAESLNLAKMGGYLMACNGAQVVEYKTDETIFCENLPANMISDILALGRKLGVAALSYDKDGVITEHADDRYVKLEAFNNGLPVREVDCLDREVADTLPKIMVVGEPEKLITCLSVFQTSFPQLNAFLSEPYFLEITNKGINKAKGLSMLLKHLNYTKDQLMSCGDGYNDLEMLAYSGLGVAMGNAYDPIKEAADWITASNDEDGVARAVERFILNG